jgi:type IV secretion system protein VirB2
MGARFECRLVCVNQHHGVALGNPIADGETVTGPVAAGISVVGIAAGGMALVFGGELSEFAKRSCYAVIATAVIVGAGTIMSTLFSSSSAVIAMTGGF